MNIQTKTERILQETEKIIVGKHKEIELILTAILAEGHILLDDVPGVGKTTLVKTLAIALGLDSKRIQFVPDLLPSDIIGMNIYNQKSGEFQLMQGPVMTNLLLADEINRAIPRTQAALLEAMEEKQVTIDGITYPLPQPFIVMATQNPVEQESTFRLPAAQLDRFMIKLSLGYPDSEAEKAMLYNLGDTIPFEKVEKVINAEELAQMQKEIYDTYMSTVVADYIVALTGATRNNNMLKMGASPRATRALYKAAKARAVMQGRDFVIPDDVQYIAPHILCHRLIVSNEARLAKLSAEQIVEQIMKDVPVPPEKKDYFARK